MPLNPLSSEAQELLTKAAEVSGNHKGIIVVAETLAGTDVSPGGNVELYPTGDIRKKQRYLEALAELESHKLVVARSEGMRILTSAGFDLADEFLKRGRILTEQRTMPDNPEIGKELIRLKNLIVQHFGTSEWLELGTLVNQFDYVNSHTRLLRSLRFGDDDYEGNALSVLRYMIDHDLGNLKTIAAYVQSKSPDEGENVSSQETAGRKIVFAPQVFTVPDGDVESDLVSVMMPFKGFGDVYDAIKGAVADAGLRCQRADDIWDHSVVIQDVFNLIFKSYIVVCDFTGKNPNVFYEA